jgi:murein endopeptidase
MKKFIIFFYFLGPLSVLASEPVGHYNAGSLIDGESLFESGHGFVSLYRHTGHHWGTAEMIQMIKHAAAYIAHRYPGKDRLQVEDISAREGGRIEPHGSHTNGLDVDIQYFKRNGVEHVGDGYADPMVSGNAISTNFDVERNWELLKALHRYGPVRVIFIDQVLKNELTRYALSINEYDTHRRVLNSLIHEENHADHMHVRLNCPASAHRCLSMLKK